MMRNKVETPAATCPLFPPGLMFPPSLLAAPALPCLAWGIGTGVCVQHRAAPSPSRDPRAPGPVFSRAGQGFRCSTMICWGAESHRPDCWKVYCNFPGVLTSRVQIVCKELQIKGILCNLHILCGELNQPKKCTRLREWSQLIYILISNPWMSKAWKNKVKMSSWTLISEKITNGKGSQVLWTMACSV